MASLIARTFGLALLAATALDASSALAEGNVHTDAPVVVTPAPAPVTVIHYRRRPGPRVMMPLKLDIGAIGFNTNRGFAGGVEGSVGIHWASLSPRPTDTDVGIGLFGGLASAGNNNSMTSPSMSTDNGVAYGGAYVEVARTLSRGSFWRTWASGRGEYLGSSAFGEDHAGFGVSGKLSAELYTSGVGISPRGVFLGSYAIGVYVEAGARDVADGMSALSMGAGLTFRTPLVFGR